MILTAEQCRAGRGQVGLSQSALSQAAGVALKTVSDFENGKTHPYARTLEKIRTALEAAGVAFIEPTGEESGLTGVGGQVTVGSAVTWITATELKQWADRREFQGFLPELIRRLVHATAGSPERVDFPCGDSVQIGGWDGIVETSSGMQFVPTGTSGWELGCDKTPKSKANRDYDNRKKDSLDLVPASTTFVFVTPRNFKSRSTWCKAKKAEGHWAEVRALDADDMEQWLALAPHVAVWLAVKMGKCPPNIITLDEFWEGWQARTVPALNSAVVLAGRERESGEIHDWVNEPPKTITVQAETEDEAIAFFSAALDTLPEDRRKDHAARCVIVRGHDAFRSLIGQKSPMVLIISDEDASLCGRAVALGHHVYVPLGLDAPTPSRDGFRLPIPEREAFVAALVELGKSSDEAKALCRDTGRSLTVLQRRLGVHQHPHWSQPENARALIPALLAGAWDESKPADKDVVSKLAGEDYTMVAAEFTRWANESDPPLRHIGTSWRLTSRLDSWFLLARFITPDDLALFETIAQEVLGLPDPSLELPPEERWMAGARGKVLPNSRYLHEGIAQTLILMAVHSEEEGLAAHSQPAAWVKNFVRRQLGEATGVTWFSLASLLPLLAEAAPDVFLQAVEDSLGQSQPPIMEMFSETDSPHGLGGSSAHPNLLWALEGLAWDPKYLGRVTLILGALARLDPGGRLSNRPQKSLKEIHILWLDHTHATLAQRMQAIDRLMADEPESAWRLLLDILHTGNDTSNSPHEMRWRPLSAPAPAPVTYASLAQGNQAVIFRLLQSVGRDISRWNDLLKEYPNLPDDTQAEMIAAITAMTNDGMAREDRMTLADTLRGIISHHRSFPDADWSMAEATVDVLAALYETIVPADPIDNLSWLFDDNWPSLMDGRHRTDDDDAIKDARHQAIREIIAAHGREGLLTLAERVKEPWTVGFIAAEVVPYSDNDWALMDQSIDADHGKNDFARGFIAKRSDELGDTWIQDALAYLRQDVEKEAMVLAFCFGLRCRRPAWDVVAQLGAKVEEGYWAQIHPHLASDPAEDVAYAVERLLAAGRPKAAFGVVSYQPTRIPPELLAQVLEVLAIMPTEEEGRFEPYSICKAFEALDTASSIPEKTLLGLEWAYLPALASYGNKRGPRILHQKLAQDANFYIDVLRFNYKHEDEAQRETENEGLTAEVIEQRADRAIELLHGWHLIPGTGPDNAIDERKLWDWVQQARTLAAENGRVYVCDHHIGEVFAYAPADPDGTWPTIAVCNVIERVRSRHLERSFKIGVLNKRGVVSKSLNEGGGQELELAEHYGRLSEVLTEKSPRVAGILQSLAENYQADARDEDIRAESRDLEY